MKRRYYLITVTYKDWREELCYVAESYAQAFDAAKQMSLGTRRAIIREREMTFEAADVLWFRIGLKKPGLYPPKRFEKAYYGGEECRKSQTS